ncbi:hypothetical protein FPQ18DRAFT_346297 [Pyronema domesticum]|uniref:Similar to Bifunctional xylanase/deacetylase acc. no. P54865 n=1 Tax=Pyronema omphalodes (strain CBS 100304) TaxID=1076935 RepID=U4KX70_PYROM|nr:hypothetical protein FPQ18DRAFT_346297 [Pyronema domesticum]CCX06376.1 Similar to Bifunctional xylanase/deacetylase; acc. no. P54865 [Pyronema omphalodes CBS 100304]
MVSVSSLLLALLPATSVLACAMHRATTTQDSVERRDSSTGQCGAANGNLSCNGTTVNRCCSQAGWCGDSTDHCGTGCQAAFGYCSPPAPAPTIPAISTRAKLGSVPYGSEIYACTKANTIALTFDDGPYLYTAALLDLLKTKGVKATFFVTGSNLDKGDIDSTAAWTSVIQRAYNEGHQIASHTWTHADLSAVDEATRKYEMVRNEQAFLKIIGKYPTYMRPPYISCNAACQATMGTLGYHVILWDLDTDDYNQDAAGLIQNSKNNVKTAYDQRWDAYMSIAHDIHYQTVYNLTSYQIDAGRAAGYTHTTLGECLQDPAANWYRTQL